MTLSSVADSGLAKKEYDYGCIDYIPPRTFKGTMLVIHAESSVQVEYIPSSKNSMNMTYSFHPPLAAPSMLSSGLFNCSVSHYAIFQQHLDCNLERECQGGEDEGGHCPFSSPLCDGWVDAQGKCYFLVVGEDHVTWQSAHAKCRKRGGDLAMMKTPREWTALWKLYDYGRRWKCAYIGLRLNSSTLLRMYRNTWSWADGIQAFDVNVTTDFRKTNWDNRDLEVIISTKRIPVWVMSEKKHCSRFICQINYNSSRPKVDDGHIPILKANLSVHKGIELGLTLCPGGHLVHSFLQCYTGSHCGVDGVTKYCHVLTDDSWWSIRSSSVGSLHVYSVTTTIFECDSERSTVPYTLVCDFRPDCSDHSDETFCIH